LFDAKKKFSRSGPHFYSLIEFHTYINVPTVKISNFAILKATKKRVGSGSGTLWNKAADPDQLDDD
jgi:hypothetical protein